jgi:uncharacterized protein YbaR (Trm112 family)
MALAPDLLSLLACPEDKGPLYYLDDLAVLFNPRLQRAYRVRDGIPVMLIDEAQRLEPSESERLWARVRAENIPPTFESATFPTTETENNES